MRSRAILTAVLLFGVLVPITVATTGDGVAPPRQWAIVFFAHPTLVSTEILMGPYLIVHDDAKMARGEPCTSMYAVETLGRPDEAVVSFSCVPHPRPVVERFTIATDWDTARRVHNLTEYQFAGEVEGHGVSVTAFALDQARVGASLVCAR